MKYAVVLCDGMSDFPLDFLGGMTPMEKAAKPCMNALALDGSIGLVKTVPEDMPPGSDVANLSVLGWDPKQCYTGRSPLEAVSMGLNLSENDVTFRLNLITLSEERNYRETVMSDYCADDISTVEADELIKAVREAFGSDTLEFHTGVSYRHCMVIRGGGDFDGAFTPPHDISDRKIKDYLPYFAPVILELMEKSRDILESHPINIKRKQNGRKPANSIWLWGNGTRPRLESFYEKYGVRGGVISAVDLIKGIGKAAGMDVIDVPGATGYIDTDFAGKYRAAVDYLRGTGDFVFIHVEAPDECGHRGETDNKIRAIELIDSEILAPLTAALRRMGDFKLMVLPDHPTPLSLKTHTSDPVPYLVYSSTKDPGSADGGFVFCERTAEDTGNFEREGHRLMDTLILG